MTAKSRKYQWFTRRFMGTERLFGHNLHQQTEGSLRRSLETSDDRSLPSCHRQVDRFFYRPSIVQMFLQRLHRGRRNGTFFAPGRSIIRPLHNTIHIKAVFARASSCRIRFHLVVLATSLTSSQHFIVSFVSPAGIVLCRATATD